MILNSKINFKPIEVKCIVNRYDNLNSTVKRNIGSNIKEDMLNYERFFQVGQSYFIYGIEISMGGKVEFLESSGYGGFVPAWLFEINYEVPKSWHIKSYIQENSIIKNPNYDYLVPTLRIGFEELVYQEDYIINFWEHEKKEREIFESYQQYEEDLRQKRAEAAAVKYMYPYQPPSK